MAAPDNSVNIVTDPKQVRPHWLTFLEQGVASNSYTLRIDMFPFLFVGIDAECACMYVCVHVCMCVCVSNSLDA